MAYDNILSQQVEEGLRLILPKEVSLEQKQMFGGIAYFYKGKMMCGVLGGALICRIKTDKMPKLLEIPGIRPMDFTGKPLKEFIFISPGLIPSMQSLVNYLELGLEHARWTLKEIS